MKNLAVAAAPAVRLPIERVDIIGVPMDLGADRRGVDMGPSAIRYARLHERLRTLGVTQLNDHGNLSVPIAESAEETGSSAKYLPTIQEVCAHLAQLVESVVKAGGFPVVLGGDHSIAIGTIAGLARARGKPPGVVWIDAHGDINTPLTSPSGNVHGMPLALALDAGHADPRRTVLVGLRDVDPGEKEAIRERGVRAFSMADIDRMGMVAVMQEALRVVADGPRSVHVSFDMDGIDPSEAPGVGTPVKGGITYREAHLAMEVLASSGALGSIEMTEINPILDRENQTGTLAVGLILSGLGESIL